MLRKALDSVNRVARYISDVVDAVQNQVTSATYREGLDRLPPEVLCIIFEFVVMGEEGAQDVAAISLSHVNRAWRRLALILPHLWTKIELGDGPGKVLTFLDRSKNSLLDVSFHPLLYRIKNTGASLDGLRQAVVPAVTAVMDHSHRWRSLNWRAFDGDAPSHLDISLHPIEQLNVPMLEDLTLYNASKTLRSLPPSIRSLTTGMFDPQDFPLEVSFRHLTTLSCDANPSE